VQANQGLADPNKGVTTMAFTKKQQAQTRELAHAYASYIKAKQEKNAKQIKLWADTLLEKQERYGCEIIEAFYLKATLSSLAA